MEVNMTKLRSLLLLCCLVLCLAMPATAEVRVGISIGLPHLSIGINVPAYPELALVPGYPVYYAPRVRGNYFFYDGLFWAYQNDDWYLSSWYNGPWYFVEPGAVPLFLLRVPVFYYMDPPRRFHGWHVRTPPRWGELWGPDWERHRSGWDRWDRHTIPPPAPLPNYQRQYFGERYPSFEQQPQLREKHYRYQSREFAIREPRDGKGPQPPPQVTRERAQTGGRPPEARQSRPAPPRPEVPPQWGKDSRRESPQVPGQRHYRERESHRRLHPYGYEEHVRKRFAPNPQGPQR